MKKLMNTKGRSSSDGGAPRHILARREASRRETAAEEAAVPELDAWRKSHREKIDRREKETYARIANQAARLAKFDEQHVSEAVVLDRLGFVAAAKDLRREGWVSRESVAPGRQLVGKLVREHRLTPVRRKARQWTCLDYPDLSSEVYDPMRYFSKAEVRKADAWIDKHVPKTATVQRLVEVVAKTAEAEGKPEKLQQFFVDLLEMNTAPPKKRLEKTLRLIENLLRR